MAGIIARKDTNKNIANTTMSQIFHKLRQPSKITLT